MKNKKEIEQKIIDSEFKESIDELFQEQEVEEVEEKEEQEEVVKFLGKYFYIQEDGFLGSSNDDFVETIVSTIERAKNALTIQIENDPTKDEYVPYSPWRGVVIKYRWGELQKRRFVDSIKSFLSQKRLIHYKDLQEIAVCLANLGLWDETKAFLDGFNLYPTYGHKNFVSIEKEAKSLWFIYAKYKLLLSIIKAVRNDDMKQNMIKYLARINIYGEQETEEFLAVIFSKIWVEKIHRSLFNGFKTTALESFSRFCGFDSTEEYIDALGSRAYDKFGRFYLPIEEIATVINNSSGQFDEWEQEEFSIIHNFYLAQKQKKRESSI